MCIRDRTNTHTKMNLSTVKWAQWDKTQARELLGLFICVCIALCTIVAHNIAQNRPDNFPSYHPDNHHCSNDVYLREGGGHLQAQGLTKETAHLQFTKSMASFTFALPLLKNALAHFHIVSEVKPGPVKSIVKIPLWTSESSVVQRNCRRKQN